MEVRTGHRPTAHINVTPMIDVLLVLLVIFMLAVRQRTMLPVNVPPPRQAEGGPALPQVVLELRGDGSYAINGAAASAAVLPARLRALYGGGDRHVLYIRAAPTRRYREVIDAVDMARGAGVPVIGYMP